VSRADRLKEKLMPKNQTPQQEEARKQAHQAIVNNYTADNNNISIDNVNDINKDDNNNINIEINDNVNNDFFDKLLGEDKEIKKKEDTQTLRGFYIENDLLAILDSLASNGGKGLKSKIVNEALRRVFQDKGLI
jgi:hypothetical protein